MTLWKADPVDESFFQQPTLELARSLLGCLLVKESKEGTTAGMIVETEAYLGAEDRAAHSFGNKRTKRTEVMFKKPGHVYTYVMHTHCLVNVVGAEEGVPHAVLIRAVEPYAGLDLMKARRPVDKLTNLTSGPGKLTKAMGITMEDYGRAFFERPLYIARNDQLVDFELVTGTRIGIGGAGEAQAYPYRFWIKDNPYVSK